MRAKRKRETFFLYREDHEFTVFWKLCWSLVSKSKLFFLGTCCKLFLHLLKTQSNRSRKSEGSFSCDSSFAKYDPTKIKANFGKSSFWKHIFLFLFLFTIIVPKHVNPFLDLKWVYFAKLQFLPKISRLATPKSAGRSQWNIYPRIFMTYTFIWYGYLRYLLALSKMSL